VDILDDMSVSKLSTKVNYSFKSQNGEGTEFLKRLELQIESS